MPFTAGTGLRRCEVLGLRLDDLQVANRRVLIGEGKGGHQRLIPVSGLLFASVASYLDSERPAEADTDRLFVVLKGPRRGRRPRAPGHPPMNEKTCHHCGRTLPMLHFGRDKRTADGWQASCKRCRHAGTRDQRNGHGGARPS
jgi:integrase